MEQRNQKSYVIFGDELRRSFPNLNPADNLCKLFGTCGEMPVCMMLDRELLSKHIMALGAIGTGKTNAFFQVISELTASLTPNDVMIIFDTKGDFYKEFYEPGDVVISNDETATGYWNIFREIDESSPYESIVEISKSLFAEACKKTSQVFFPNAAKDLFMAVMLHFIRSAEDPDAYIQPEHCTNENLVAYINGNPVSAIRDTVEAYEDLMAMSSYIADDESAQTQGVMSELQQVIRQIFIGYFMKDGTLSLRELVRKKGGKRVFIEYDLNYGRMLSPIYSLMFDMAIKEALGRKRSEGNVYFITDEFKLLPNLEHIDDAVNFGRSLGLKFMIGIQNVEQIYENYGEQRARSILSGFMTSFMFRVNDAKSREFIQGIFGKNQKSEGYLGVKQSGGFVEKQREANVVEDWDISRLRTGEAIIGIPNVEPFVFRFQKYQTKEIKK